MYYENSKDNDVELVKNAHFDTYKFREENGKVYLKGLEPYPEQLEILLIDMTPSSGEPVNCISYDYVTGEPSITESKVLKIDSIRVNDIIRKRITFPPNQFNSGNDETNYWVEGIGSTNLFITNGAVPLPSRAYSYKFIGCYDGDNCIFTLDDFSGSGSIEFAGYVERC